jgi:hypothetical protein
MKRSGDVLTDSLTHLLTASDNGLAVGEKVDEAASIATANHANSENC